MVNNEMNFFWGGGRMSYMRFLTLETFCKHNPNWHVNLWVSRRDWGNVNSIWITQEKQDFFNYDGPDYLAKVAGLSVHVQTFEDMFHMFDLTPVHESDLFRWKLLSHRSCWYADMDILWVKPMPTIDEKVKVVICQANAQMAIGLLASDGENEFYPAVYQKAVVRVDSSRYQSAGTEVVHEAVCRHPNLNNVEKIGSKIRRTFVRGDGEFLDLTQNTVYPFFWDQMAKVFEEENPIPSNTVGIHWYAGTEVAQTFNNRIISVADLNWPNTFCTNVKESLGI